MTMRRGNVRPDVLLRYPPLYDRDALLKKAWVRPTDTREILSLHYKYFEIVAWRVYIGKLYFRQMEPRGGGGQGQSYAMG